MADEETYGLDDELPPLADEVHGIPADDLSDDDGPVADIRLPAWTIPTGEARRPALR